MRNVLVAASIGMLLFATLAFAITLKTRSSPASLLAWAKWTAVNFVSMSAQRDAGIVGIELWISKSQLLSTSILLVVTAVFVIASRPKKWWQHLGTSEYVGIVLFAAGWAAWQVFDAPMLAVVGNGLANGAGLIHMLKHARKHPQGDAELTYWFLRGGSTTSATLAFVSRGGLNLVGLVPQLIGVAMSTLMFFVARASKPQKQQSAVSVSSRQPRYHYVGAFGLRQAYP